MMPQHIFFSYPEFKVEDVEVFVFENINVISAEQSPGTDCPVSVIKAIIICILEGKKVLCVSRLSLGQQSFKRE